MFLSSGIVSSEVVGLDPDGLDKMTSQGAVVIDIRTPAEWENTGVIPASQPLMFYDEDGNSDSEKWLKQLTKLKNNPDQPVVLVCHSGGRSSKVGEFLDKQIGMKNIHHLEGGISGWKKAGKPTKPCDASGC